MKALMKCQPGRGVDLVEVPEPVCGSGDVILRVEAAGICGTDLHIYNWADSYAFMTPLLPIILGHEFAGVVEEIGSDVTGIRVGDRVAVRPSVPCGHCYYCRTNRRHFCEQKRSAGLHYHGGFAKYARITPGQAIPLPDSITMEQAALIEPMGVAANAVNNTGVMLGDTVVITGPGAIGLLTLLFAKCNGAGRCLVVGAPGDEDRLALAQELGADQIVVNGKQDLRQQVLQFTQGYGANILFECTGVPALLAQCVDLVQKAGKICAVGIYPRPVELDMSAVVRGGKQIIGTYGGLCAFEQMVAWMSSQNSMVQKAYRVITHRSSLEDAQEAFSRGMSRESIKELFTQFD